MTDLADLSQAIKDGNDRIAVELSRNALREGVSAREITGKGLIAGMDRVAQMFKANDCNVPEILVSTRAMRAAMEVLRPSLSKEWAGFHNATVVIGAVRHDLHDLGKSIVSMYLEGSGFNVLDLGVDVSEERFVEAAQNGASVIAMTALLTTTMHHMADTIEALQKARLRDQVRVIIGGNPISQNFADEIGADGYCGYWPDVVPLIKRLSNLA
jgi:5-methyltetrahydrofolate--homocysteine methyltransferase